MGRSSHRYSRWDGTQEGFDLDAYRLFGQISEDLLYHGDVSAALRRLMNEGFSLDDRPDADRVQGLRELIQRVRERRREMSENADLGGVFSEIADALEKVVDTEREALDSLERDARESGDERRARTASATAAERRLTLDLLPGDLAGKMQSLSEYDFVSAQAAQDFADLKEKLRAAVADMYFDQMSQAVGGTTAQDMERLRDALGALSTMIEQRRRGEDLDPSFESFMERFGDLFPGKPRDLDELLEQLARRMAAAQAMLNSMSPEQRAQLAALAEQLLEDMDLAWQVERLAGNLRQAFPDLNWGRSYSLGGGEPMSLPGLASLMEQMGDLDALEDLLTSSPGPGWLAEADMEKVRDLLGEDEARSLERLSRIARSLEEAGLIEQREGKLTLTARGARRMGEGALAELFSRLERDRLGAHERSTVGAGHERDGASKPYEYGDPFSVNIVRSLSNAVQRNGAGIPVKIAPEDLEVDRVEDEVRSATVLALDLSLSMPMRDNFLPAKKMAIALSTLITTRFPHDFFGVVTFSEVAREVKPRELASVSWDFVYGTNLAHALMLSRRLLAGQPGSKQIVLVTDGEPTAHLDESGEVFFQYPPVSETIERTLAEVVRCTKAGITINTFAIDAEGHLRRFLERVAALNRGRVFFTDARSLGDYVLVDFIERRRSQSTRRRSA